jgi:phthiocerol/phenolphthiocerol synthesis type-I polyketide synthase E
MNAANSNGIAIVGMAGRFPKAPDLEQFWRDQLSESEGDALLKHQELKHILS